MGSESVSALRRAFSSAASVSSCLRSASLKNGSQTRAEITSVQMDQITAGILPPVTNHAAKIGGMVQGICKTGRPMMSKYISDQVEMHRIIGVRVNGIISSGLKTIGQPKMTGSLIQNIAEGRESLPTDLYSRLRERSMAMTSPMVAPVPPRHIKTI